MPELGLRSLTYRLRTLAESTKNSFRWKLQLLHYSNVFLKPRNSFHINVSLTPIHQTARVHSSINSNRGRLANGPTLTNFINQNLRSMSDGMLKCFALVKPGLEKKLQATTWLPNLSRLDCNVAPKLKLSSLATNKLID
jgi:hypothetical protein